MITITNPLDMHSSGVPLHVHLSQYDEDFTLVFNLFASVGTFSIDSGTTVAIRGTKTDGNGYSVAATLDVSNKRVTVAGDQQMTAAAGPNEFELTLSKNDKELNTANFIIDVERAALDKDTLPSGSVIRELVDVIDRTDEIIAAANLADAACETVEGYKTAAEQAATDAAASESSASGILTSVNQKYAQISAIKTEADTIAAQALEAAGNAESEAAEANSAITQMGNRVGAMELAAESYVDNGYVENGVAYFEHNGTVLFEITGIGGGGGGGGDSGNNAVITVSNATGWLSKTISSGSDCEISLTWTSIEDETPTGNGALTITNNNVTKATMEVEQGTVTVNLKNYLATGANIVKVRIADVYGNSRTINFTITVIELTLSSTFDTSAVFSSAISFPYTPVGAVSKTVYFYLDNQLLTTYTTTVSGRQLTQTIAAQSHGAHTLRVYFTASINGETVSSNELYYEFISIDPLEDDVIIASPFNTSTVNQYTTIQIPYTVYDPAALTAEVKLYAGTTLLSTQTVDRTQHVFSYRADEDGTLVLKITCGSVTKQFTITVQESDIDVEAETEDLVLYLSSAGRSNSEGTPGTWTYGTGADQIACTFTDFNFSSDGWQRDSDGLTCLRVSGDARLTIPYKPFATDFRSTGKTIELEFATRNVLDYDATILSCMNGGRGISLTAQKAMIASEQSEISTQYKEEEHVRIAFAVEKRAENRLMLIYINGICSGAVQYPNDDDFSQVSPVNISVGSSDCTIDLYCIRVYDNDLNRYQILDNWIADTQDGALMLERFMRNNVFDAYGKIVISKLPSDLPYMIRSAGELPQYKGDKKTIEITYVNPAVPTKSFTATNVQSDVQGTSSQYYPRKNYKDKYKSGFVMTATGSSANKYAINTNAIAVNTFCMKADVASSEGANNVELARLYNEACPYKTPAQVANSKVRQGIDGFPIVMFWDDGENTSFLGKYNFNNDKGTEEVFGFDDPDESWEILNNTSDRVLWKSDDYSGNDWLNDFEARYPDTDPAYVDKAQLQEFAEWIVSTDTSAATGDALDQSVTYDGTTYTTDSAAYRLAKFKAEIGNYCEMQSTLFYYLFTELFLMVDSRAKNAFPSFIGSEVSSS